MGDSLLTSVASGWASLHTVNRPLSPDNTKISRSTLICGFVYHSNFYVFIIPLLKIIARGKIINIEHNEDYSYLKLFIRNGAGLRHTYLTFRYDPKIFYISKNQYVIITAHIENKQNQSKIEKQKNCQK